MCDRGKKDEPGEIECMCTNPEILSFFFFYFPSFKQCFFFNKYFIK